MFRQEAFIFKKFTLSFRPNSTLVMPSQHLKPDQKQYALLIAFVILSFSAFAQDLESIPHQKPVTISGSLDARAIAYSVDGIPARRKPFSYILSGYTNINLYGSLDVPLSFTLSEQDRSFSQPFNQFGLSPRYKWLTVHGGYRNLSFSPYTLDGYTMLGAGIELNPGKFHVAVMYGRMNRATTIDTTLGTLQPFSFSRKGVAVKLGYGDDKSFFTISALKAKDDSSSVKVDPQTKELVRAAANTVASVAGRLQFAGHFFIEGDGGASLWTNDIGSTYAITDSSEWVDKLKNIMPVNGTSEFNIAYRGAAGYAGKIFGLKLEYRHVDPQFRSMGVYYFNNDVESYTVSPSLLLLKNRLRLNGSIGRQKDNVKDQKEATTTRTIGMANLSWDITQRFGFDANYTNYSSNSKPTVVLVQNKYLLAQSNNNISFTPRYVFADTKHSHVIVASYNRSQLKDDNSTTQAGNDITTDIMFLNYTYTIVQSALSITGGANRAVNKLSTGDFKNMSYTLSFNKSMLKNKLQGALSNTYTDSKGPTGKTGILNTLLSGGYQPTTHHRISLRYSLLNNRPDNANPQVKFTEHTGEIGYTYSF